MDVGGGWFTNGVGQAGLDERQRLLMTTLIAMLDRVRPGQVDPGETALTSEGPETLIAIIPHRGMAGLSIVVRLDLDVIAVSWAQIRSLAYHADLDQDVHVGSFAEDADPFVTRCQKAVACVRQQLDRPIDMRLIYCREEAEPIRVEYDLRGEGRDPVRVAVVGTRFPWLFARRRQTTWVAHFTDTHAPPFVEACAAREWFR